MPPRLECIRNARTSIAAHLPISLGLMASRMSLLDPIRLRSSSRTLITSSSGLQANRNRHTSSSARQPRRSLPHNHNGPQRSRNLQCSHSGLPRSHSRSLTRHRQRVRLLRLLPRQPPARTRTRNSTVFSAEMQRGPRFAVGLVAFGNYSKTVVDVSRNQLSQVSAIIRE